MGRLLAACVVMVLTVSVLPASAADPAPAGPIKIGVVSVDRVFKGYKATQSKEAELQKVAQSKQAERDKRVAEIRSMRDELALLNDQNRDKQRQAIDDKLQKLAAFDQQTKESLRDQREEALSALIKEIEEVVNSIAKDESYQLILSDHAVLYRVEALDLTDQVVSSLNDRYAKAGHGG